MTYYLAGHNPHAERACSKFLPSQVRTHGQLSLAAVSSPSGSSSSMNQRLHCRMLLWPLILAGLSTGRATCGRFKPFNQHDLAAETIDCFANLDIPAGRVRLYQVGVFPDDPGTWCLVRCVAIKLGVYGDRYGPDVGRLYVQFSKKGVIGGQSEVRFKQAAYSCIAALVDEYGGACERAYHMMIDCFGDQIRKMIGSQLTAVTTEVGKNRTDPCVDCYRMFDELYRLTVVDKKTCEKCYKSGKCNKKKN